jgi:DNA-binding PadR family transcriptional regulator
MKVTAQIRYRQSEKGKARAREHLRRYRNSPKGKANRVAWRKEWRPKNTAIDQAHRAKYNSTLPDAYVRKNLKRRGVLNPLPDQIETERRRIRLLRARRTLALLLYGSGIQN